MQLQDNEHSGPDSEMMHCVTEVIARQLLCVCIYVCVCVYAYIVLTITISHIILVFTIILLFFCSVSSLLLLALAFSSIFMHSTVDVTVVMKNNTL